MIWLIEGKEGREVGGVRLSKGRGTAIKKWGYGYQKGGYGYQKGGYAQRFPLTMRKRPIS